MCGRMPENGFLINDTLVEILNKRKKESVCYEGITNALLFLNLPGRCMAALDASILRGEMRMIIILMGPPGSGKGTQAEFISEQYAMPCLSSGELFRKEVKKNC